AVLLLALVALLGTSATALAQVDRPKSDTISLATFSKDSLGFQLQDFGTLNSGQTECHTIFFQNKTSSVVVIKSVRGDGFTATAIPTLPIVLLQNEIVSLTNLCFTGGNSTYATVYGYLSVGYTVNQTDYVISAKTLGHQVPDTLLNKPCVTMTLDNNVFGPIIMDGDVSHTVTITSNRHESIVINQQTDSIHADDAAFHITGITFPYTLSALEVKTFTITFSPRSNVPNVVYRYVGNLRFYAANCSEPSFDLIGVAIPPTDPNTPTDLNAGTTDVLAMISDNTVTTQTFNFKNSGSTNLKITGVSLKNGKSFAITDIQPSNTLPFTLTPGQSMSVTLTMTTVTNGVYYDEVIITAEAGIISMNFELQGLRTNGTAGVNTNATGLQNVSIYPNPSHGDVSVAMPGIRNARIEVLDVLGKVIASTTASDLWNWKSTAPAGTYVVHVSGTDASGKAFQSYDRFIIEK
ncbi:MAG: T9SS type A sorting domain-containing protein, partial [Bacteroidota bacterium]|nr:T9SS type A sorting domain-containing protein [Bacteroidota bacterium]